MLDTENSNARATSTEEPAALRALLILRSLLEESREEPSLKVHALGDLDLLRTLEGRLASDASDPNSIKWLRQLGLSWSSRLRGINILRFRRLFDYLDRAQTR